MAARAQRAAQHARGGANDRLDVLGLVVGGRISQGDRPWAPRTLGGRADGQPTPPTPTIAAAFDELGDLYELDGAIVHRVRRLPQRRQGRARGAGVGRGAHARGPRHGAAGNRQDARGEDRRAAGHRHDPRGREAAREVPARPDRHHAPARASGPSARAGCSTSSASTRSRRCARPPRSSSCATSSGFGREVRGGGAGGVRGRRRRASPRRASCCTKALADRRGDRRRRCARTRPRDRVELAGCGAAAGRQRQGPRHRRHRRRPARAARGARRARRDRVELGSPGENAARGAHAHRHVGRPARRRARPVRQPAAALHRLARRTTSRCASARCASGLHVCEYGILDDATGETLRCATEEEVYERLGLPWIPPELREDRGELDLGVESPRADRRQDDLKGDLHCHTVASDGRNTIEEMARARAASAATSTSRSPTTRRRTASATTSRPTRCARRSSWSASSTRTLDGIEVLSGPRRTSCPTARPTTTTTCSPSSTGSSARVHTSFGMSTARDDRRGSSPRSSTRGSTRSAT